MPARRCDCALEHVFAQPAGTTALPAFWRCTLAGQGCFPVCRAHEPRCRQFVGEQSLPVDARQPGIGLPGGILGCVLTPTRPDGRQRQLAGGQHHFAAGWHDTAGFRGLISLQFLSMRSATVSTNIRIEKGRNHTLSLFKKMTTNNILTYKAVLSNKAALALTLSSTPIDSTIFKEPNFKMGIDRKFLEEKIGEQFFVEFEKLNNKDYLNKAIEEMRKNKFMLDIYKSVKKTPPKTYMTSILDNIEKGYIEFTSKDIVKKDYIFVLTPQYQATIFTLSKMNFPNDDERRNFGIDLFEKFKSNDRNFKDFYNDICEKGLEKEFSSFGSSLLDSTFRDGLEYRSEKIIITALLKSGFGTFIENI